MLNCAPTQEIPIAPEVEVFEADNDPSMALGICALGFYALALAEEQDTAKVSADKREKARAFWSVGVRLGYFQESHFDSEGMKNSILADDIADFEENEENLKLGCAELAANFDETNQLEFDE